MAAHRTNLNRLMIADPAKIDALALTIQDWNTMRSRMKTPMLSSSGALWRALDKVHVPVNGIWGEHGCACQSARGTSAWRRCGRCGRMRMCA